MPHYKYLIIGGGMTADAAVKGIREIDADGLDRRDRRRNASALQTPAAHQRPLEGQAGGEHLAEGDRVGRGLAPDTPRGRRLILRASASWMTRGTEYSYDKLLLATGGTPRRLQFDPPGVIYYRTFDDYQRCSAALRVLQAFRRHRRRVHRLRDRRGARDERQGVQ